MGWLCDLICPITGQCDKQTSNAEDVDQILTTIPLQEGIGDFPAWHLDLKGAFSGMSGYKCSDSGWKMLLQEKPHPVLWQIRQQAPLAVGNNIWSLKLPRKKRYVPLTTGT